MTLPDRVQKLLRQRYLQPNENWEQLVERVVVNVCGNETEETRNRIKDYIYKRIWLPNSPCLVNAGLKNNGLMACFVVGPTEDTLEHHVEVLGDIAVVGKFGGGCGFTGTFIRPEGSPVAGSAHGFAYGPNKWAVRVNDYLDMITQGGFRKMALMYTIRSDHPDLEKFIDLKQDKGEHFATRFNQSVMATEKFMKFAVANPNGEESRLLKKIAKNAWQNGEPGLLFYDNINQNTPYKYAGESIEATNPCGEQPLPPYGSCNLGSINLSHDEFFYDNGEYNYNALAEAVVYLTQFLDNVGNANRFPNEKFETWYKEHRPIGIGVMGLADALLRLEMRYGSRESLRFIEKTMDFIHNVAKTKSEELGKERGIPAACKYLPEPRRNITLISIAPTGSIGFIADCSHGIEPVFSPIYERIDERGEQYTFKHPYANESYFVSAINDNPKKVVSWKEHIKVQSAVQEYTDSGVSKTINFPNDSSIDDVYNAMLYAWASGCKGITVYRSGSREIEVLKDKKENAIHIESEELICPVCEDEDKETRLIMQEGCEMCPVCGYSLCTV